MTRSPSSTYAFLLSKAPLVSWVRTPVWRSTNIAPRSRAADAGVVDDHDGSPSGPAALVVVERRARELSEGEDALHVAQLEVEEVDLPAGAAVVQQVGIAVEEHKAEAAPMRVLDVPGFTPTGGICTSAGVM